MKITKDIEKEVMTVYDSYWECYFNGDMKKMASLIDDDFIVVGSTSSEIFFNKKEMMDYYTATSDQIAGKVEFRNREVKILPLDGQIHFTDLGEIYIQINDEWNFYSKFRISSLLIKRQGIWKFIQQHGSVPDSKTGEREQIGFDKISRENLELRDAIKRRTAELENKNRELEIESSLERVRAVAMGMNKSEDLLSICEISFFELKKLGFENLRNAVIHIPNDDQNYFMDYDFSDFTGGKISKIDYGLHPILDDYLNKIRSSKDAFFEVVIEKDQLEGWREFRKKSEQMNDPRLDNAEALYYYLFSIGLGDIGISTFNSIDDSQIKILKRFRNVFNLAYKRYTDIETAEAQAREAKIEGALERVRACALGMNKSEEVGNVSDLLFSELNKLHLDLSGCSIVIVDDINNKIELWRARSEIVTKPFESSSLDGAMNILKKNMPDYFPKFYSALGKRKGQLIVELSRKRRLQIEKAFAEYHNYSSSEKPKLTKNAPQKLATHYLFFKLGYLALISEKIISNKDLSIARRFVEVFDFAYTRFLDIKNAEAQAREAQIEAALEKVRSRSLAMHNSDEIKR